MKGQPVDASINLGRLAQAYVAIKDARTVKRHAWEKEDLELEADQDKLKAVMLRTLNDLGGKSINTDYGTIIRSEKIKPSAADWQAIWDWATAHDGFEIVEKRLKVTFVKEYMEEHGGRPPPGVNVHREFEVSVRRPNASSPDRGGNDADDGPE